MSRRCVGGVASLAIPKTPLVVRDDCTGEEPGLLEDVLRAAITAISSGGMFVSLLASQPIFRYVFSSKAKRVMNPAQRRALHRNKPDAVGVFEEIPLY